MFNIYYLSFFITLLWYIKLYSLINCAQIDTKKCFSKLINQNNEIISKLNKVISGQNSLQERVNKMEESFSKSSNNNNVLEKSSIKVKKLFYHVIYDQRDLANHFN